MHRLNDFLIVTLTIVILVLSSPVDAKVKNYNSSPSTGKFLIKKQDRALYFVLLEDEPLASYDGAIKGLQKTKMDFISKYNQGSTAILDVKSKASLEYLGYLKSKSDSVLSKLEKALSRKVHVNTRFSIVLNGFSAYLNDVEKKILSNVSGVKTISLAKRSFITTDSGPEFIEAKEIWEEVRAFEGTKGEGVIVGVMDTGIDPTNPSFADIGGDGYDHTNPLGENTYLGDCIDEPVHCNDKLVGIVSYPAVTELEQATIGLPEIGIDYHGHGSHTASTAAGNILKDVPIYNVLGIPSDFKIDISGVAPHANIVSYQVCTATSGCFPDLAVRSIEHAIQHGIKIMNYSVGGSPGNPWTEVDTIAFKNARAAGLHIATSAGNSGPNDYTVGSPGHAPWVTTVAAATHDRDFKEVYLTGFQGGEGELPNEIKGTSITKGYTGPVVSAANFGDPLCLEPFQQGVFRGEIVLCERGEIARVEKGSNVLAGGAGGMILVNSVTDSTLDEDPHVLPAIHVSHGDGQIITNWLSSGERHVATITSTELLRNQDVANTVAYFSSRGPSSKENSNWRDLPSPDISAPGVDIYAANASFQPFFEEGSKFETPFRFLSGTSMASPHVAGALALIHTVRPEWTPAEAQSAIMMTANSSMKAEDVIITEDNEQFLEIRDANYFDSGSGMIKAHTATLSGLVMEIPIEEYEQADPANGGEPSELNLPSMIKHGCVITCTWKRKVKATENSSWTVSVKYLTPDFNLTTNVQTFSLESGEFQEIEITATGTAESSTEWSHAQIILTPRDANSPTLSLFVAVRFVGGVAPAEHRSVVQSSSGSLTLNGFNSVGVVDFQSKVIGLTPLDEVEDTTVGDRTVGSEIEVWDNVEENFQWQIIDIKPDDSALIAKIIRTTSNDIDLYVGRDFDLDGRPSLSEFSNSRKLNQYCVSGNFGSDEFCEIANPSPGKWWVAAHNFAGVYEEGDVTELGTAVLNMDSANLTVSGPESTVAGEGFGVKLDFEELGVFGAEYYAYIELGTSEKNPSNIGRTLISILRNPDPFKVLVEDNYYRVKSPVNVELDLLTPSIDKVQAYSVSTVIPIGWEIQSSSEDYSVDNNVITWQLESKSAETSFPVKIVFGTDNIEHFSDEVLEFSWVLEETGESGSFTSESITVEQNVRALIEGSESLQLNGIAGETLTLSAEESYTPRAEDSLSYSWKQLSGPTVNIPDTEAGSISVNLPEVLNTDDVVLELVVTNGRSSASAVATINVRNAESSNSKSGSGSFSFALVLCCLLPLVAYRAKPHRKCTTENLNFMKGES